MHWVNVEGYPMPIPIGGHPALELCNTWAGWSAPPSPEREWLRDFDRLAVWTGHVRLLTPTSVARLREQGRRDPTAAHEVLAATRQLRTALHDILLDPHDTDAFRHVAEEAQRAAAAATLETDRTGLAHWSLPDDLGLRLPLLAGARAAADLLTTPARTEVRACPADDCGWLFLDPRGRRRWCSMATCGNRAKVRAWAARRQPL
ncbi:CGNR zinc finger domain-containing protein [Verrucosispora sp. NA02020]|uniref:CGNR zinc finger domain-containing protein n=1 Tax=Verrucosispora sp. NA02020 TaxID=2742132 RepID=UPI00158FFD57|nr:CGNR zinc finger domain-containing protein [Verrucosispora sp. NA02020]QKW13555.1 CGNR zinc finger domain-containing protein [Verrucosispora sp. NA02020]